MNNDLAAVMDTEELQGIAQKNRLKNLVIKKASLIVFWLIEMALIVTFGIFSFNNPDKQAWYAVSSDGVKVLYETEPTFAEYGQSFSNLENSHSRFLVWFRWGFFLMLSILALAIFAGFSEKFKFLKSAMTYIFFALCFCIA